MKKIFTLLFLFCVSTVANFACGPYFRTWTADMNYMFRICGDDMTGYFTNSYSHDKNCMEWAWLTSPYIPEPDIKEVVYKWSIEQLESLKQGMAEAEDNTFARWLSVHNDTEIIDFLILAKTNEQIRSRQCSVWYYYLEDDDECTQLKEVVKSLRAYKGSRLRDRYTLQLVRALFSLRKYDECISLWAQSKKYFRDGIIKDMTVEYIAGAYERLGNEGMRTLTLRENGMGRDDVSDDPDKDKFTKMCEEYFDRPQLWYYIQSRIHTLESYVNSYYPEDSKEMIEEYTYLYDKVLPIIGEEKSREMEKWYYTGAFIADKLGKQQEARSFIYQAEKCCRDGDMADEIRVLKLYINTKAITVYNQEFEEYLYNELVWLEDRMDEEMTERITNLHRQELNDGNDLNSMFYWMANYWERAMRKILIGQVVPLCLKSNYQTRALQYLKYADCGVYTDIDYRLYYNRDEVESCSTWKEVKALLNAEGDNCGWSDDFFINIDSLDVKYVKRLVDRIENPQDYLDRFLTQNSYVDPQYLDDIIGTKLIRSMRFNEAIPYLSRVSDTFQKKANVYKYFNRDPFSSAIAESPDPRYKLHFAQEMRSLEWKMSSAKDPNDKAEAILKYCCGLFSASGARCWSLTEYFLGVFPDWEEIRRNELYDEMDARANNLSEQAFEMFTDTERGVKACLDWCMYQTLLTKFPDTEAAEYIRGHCDEGCDYLECIPWRSCYLSNRWHG